MCIYVTCSFAFQSIEFEESVTNRSKNQLKIPYYYMLRLTMLFVTPSVFVNQYISFPLLAITTSIIPTKALATPIVTY